MLSELVLQTLEKDARFRAAENSAVWNRKKVTAEEEDLFKIDQLEFNKEWDNSLPTLVKEITYSTVRQQRTKADAFRSAFFGDFPELAKIDLSNILIAGGCVGHYLINTTSRYSGDIDLFVYGLTQEAADARVRQFATELISARKAAKQEDLAKKATKKDACIYTYEREIAVKLIRNANGLSIFIGNQLYQIIFRLYGSKTEILHGFDIGSSAVGFTGKDVLFTTLSRFSYEFMCNIVDTTRRSTTYESRLQKYWDRGFSIILPYFDISRLRTQYHRYSRPEYAILPYTVFGYSHVRGNQIVVTEFSYVISSDDEDGEKWDATSRENSVSKTKTDYALDDIDEYNILYINLTHILADPSKMYHFHVFSITLPDPTQKKVEQKVDEEEEEADGEEVEDDDDEPRKKKQKAKDVKEKQEQDESQVITTFFNTPPYLSKRSIDYFYGDLRAKVYMDRSLRVGLLEKYVNVCSVREITARIFSGKEKPSAVLDDVIKRQQEFVLQEADRLSKAPRAINWIVQDPGTQLTSSINPVIEAPEKWYGEYFLKVVA